MEGIKPTNFEKSEIDDTFDKPSTIQYQSTSANAETETVDLSELDANISDNLANLDYSEIKKDGFTVQGYTIADTSDHITADGKVLVTAYDHRNFIEKGMDNLQGLVTGNKVEVEPSRIYVYDNKTGELEGKIILNNHDHVGGATFDAINQILYVTGSNGKVHSYDYTVLQQMITEAKKDIDEGKTYTLDLTANSNYTFEIPNDINIKEDVEGNENNMASVFFHDGKLYSVTFENTSKLIETEIDIQTTGEEKDEVQSISSEHVADLTSAVQGLAFTEQNGKEYLVVASSVRLSESKLTLYEKEADGTYKEAAQKYISQSGLEGIYINNGRITGIFEYENQEIKDMGSVEDLIEAGEDSLKDNHKIADFLLDTWS